MKITVFTEGKLPPNNEDAGDYNETSFIVCDGSTSKKDILYAGKTGGEIASKLLAEAALGCSLNGTELIDKLSTILRVKRKELGAIGDDVEFSAVMVCARLLGDELIITQVGDTAFRINGHDEYSNPPLICDFMASTRAQYIQTTGDIAGGREYILPLLETEYIYRNNANSPVGYGEINGTHIPDKFVKTYTFKRSDVQTLEIYTDGYYALPSEPSIDAFERLHAQIEKEDPDKWKKYLSTKSRDDRTVMIVDFSA